LPYTWGVLQMSDQYQGMLDKSVELFETDMLDIIGTQAAGTWNEIHAFLQNNYDHVLIKKHWGKARLGHTAPQKQ